MRINHSAGIPAMALLALLSTGCSEPAAPPRASPPPPPVVAPASPPAPAEPPAAAPAPAVTPPAAAKPTPAAPEARPGAKPPARPATAPAAAPVREKLGAGQCRSCHRVQYDSWVKSGHARKGLDCEGCHGNGSEYAKAPVMRDPVAAKRAGLIFQTADFCEKCHPTADASFLPKAHAHTHPRR